MQNEKEKEPADKKRKWPTILAIVLIIILILALILLFKAGALQTTSPREKLDQMQAKIAVPDKENAALIYWQIAENCPADLNEPPFFARSKHSSLDEPWLTAEHPETKIYIDKHRKALETLQLASKLKECRFPLYLGDTLRNTREYDKRMDMLAAIRKHVYMLVSSANNDLAEERIDNAFQKHLCIIRIGKHFQQQPIIIDNLIGIAIEALAIKNIKTFILEDYATQKHLNSIKNNISIIDDWADKFNLIKKIERLNALTQSKNIITRILHRFFLEPNLLAPAYKRINQLHNRFVSDRRGIHLIIALKHHKDQTDNWPETLQEIAPPLPQQVLRDGYGSPFVYTKIDNSFKLYSIGENKIDEKGKRDVPDAEEGTYDDWPIWPKK